MFPTYYALNKVPKPSATSFDAVSGKTNQAPASSSLDLWLKGYDATKKNNWSAMVNLKSAYVRPTFTPSDIKADPIPSNSLASRSNSTASSPAPRYTAPFAQPSPKETELGTESTRIIFPSSWEPPTRNTHDFPPPIPPKIPISPPTIPLAPSPVRLRAYPEGWCCASTLTLFQVQISISRLCLEINWDWFDDNIPILQPDMVKVPTESTAQDTTQSTWEILSEIYQTYCKWRATGVDSTHIFTSTDPDRRSLQLWRAVVHEMIRAFGPSGDGNEETMVEFMISLVKGSETEGGDILKFINQKCRESRLQYPGGTGRTEERIRTYSFYVRLRGEEA